MMRSAERKYQPSHPANFKWCSLDSSPFLLISTTFTTFAYSRKEVYLYKKVESSTGFDKETRKMSMERVEFSRNKSINFT